MMKSIIHLITLNLFPRGCMSEENGGDRKHFIDKSHTDRVQERLISKDETDRLIGLRQHARSFSDIEVNLLIHGRFRWSDPFSTDKLLACVFVDLKQNCQNYSSANRLSMFNRL